MKKIKQFACILTSLSLSFCLLGCNSDDKDSSIEETIAETTEAVTEELTTEEITEPPVEELTEPESTEAGLELFEEDETIVNLLKTGFSFDGMGDPTVKFIPDTNTYVVIAPTSSDSIGVSFEAESGNEKWDKYVKQFTELTDAVIDTVSVLKEDKNVNFRIIHTLKTPLPLIAYENGKKVFDRYNAGTEEQAIYALKVCCDLNFLDMLGNANIEYDASINNYTVTFHFSSDNVDFFNKEGFSTSFSELCGVLEQVIKSYNSPTVTVKALEKNTDKPIYTVENGEVTYNIFD